MKLQSIRCYLSLILIGCLLLTSSVLHADESRVFVIAHSSAHQGVADKLSNTLQNALAQQIIRTEQIPLKPPAANAVIITLGKNSLQHALQSPVLSQHPIFATLISSRDYFIALKQYSSNKNNAPKQRSISALFSDPSPIYQLKLSTLLMNKPKIAFIYDEFDQRLQTPITTQAKKLNLPTPLFIALDTNDISKTLKSRAMINADVILATPNRALYNSSNAKSIIFSLLARQQALIGYSTGWVNSGALATVYSNQHDIARELTDIIQFIATHNGQLPTAAHPSRVNVKLNSHIARMLGITVANETELTKQLQQGLKQHAR